MARESLDFRASFFAPLEGVDDYGGTQTGWAAPIERWCGVHLLRGGEKVMGSRLSGRQPAILTVRCDPETKTISPGWKAEIDGREYNIREEPRLSMNRMYFEFVAESGVAT